MPISFTQPTLLPVVFLAFLGSAAGAQSPATSFGQLRALVKAGDVVTVTDNAGDIVKGRIVDVSPNRLTIVDGRLRDFAVPMSVASRSNATRVLERAQRGALVSARGWRC
jgi:hypothetical protein